MQRCQDLCVGKFHSVPPSEKLQLLQEDESAWVGLASPAEAICPESLEETVGLEKTSVPCSLSRLRRGPGWEARCAVHNWLHASAGPGMRHRSKYRMFSATGCLKEAGNPAAEIRALLGPTCRQCCHTCLCRAAESAIARPRQQPLS